MRDRVFFWRGPPGRERALAARGARPGRRARRGRGRKRARAWTYLRHRQVEDALHALQAANGGLGHDAETTRTEDRSGWAIDAGGSETRADGASGAWNRRSETREGRGASARGFERRERSPVDVAAGDRARTDSLDRAPSTNTNGPSRVLCIELAHERISVRTLLVRYSLAGCSRGTTSRAEPPPVAKSHDVRAPPRDFSRPVAVARAPASFATPPRGFPARAPLRERSARAILGQSGRDAGCANDHPPGVRSPRSRPRPPGRRPARAPRVRARAGTLARRRTPRRPPRGPRRSRRKYLLPPMRLGRATPRSPWSARRSRRDRSPAPASPSPRVPARRTTRKEPPSRRTRPPHR